VLHTCEIMTPRPRSPRHGAGNIVPPDLTMAFFCVLMHASID
jgi:hypothetical protein